LNIHLYTICWNDAEMLGFFFRHYDRFVDRYVFYDDGSDAPTLDILRSHPRAELRRLQRAFPDSFLLSAPLQQNAMWKESRGQADWVVVTSIDEHLYHPDLPAYLQACRRDGITIIPGLGYQMISEHFPAPDALLCRDCPWGAPYDPMNKLGIFDPDAIEETNYIGGRHSARPTGRVRFPPRDELLNLHYKYLGIDYIRRRNADLLAKLGSGNDVLPAHMSYARDTAQVLAAIEEWQRASDNISDPALQPWKSHRDTSRHTWWTHPPWWRVRWWHPQWWTDAISPSVKLPLVRAARAAGLMPKLDHVQ